MPLQNITHCYFYHQQYLHTPILSVQDVNRKPEIQPDIYNSIYPNHVASISLSFRSLYASTPLCVKKCSPYLKYSIYCCNVKALITLIDLKISTSKFLITVNNSFILSKNKHLRWRQKLLVITTFTLIKTWLYNF